LGREFAAWLGLTPLHNSSSGKERMGRRSKMADKYLRRLLVVGMISLVRRAPVGPASVDPRIVDLLARKPVRLAPVAMANRAAHDCLGRHGARRDLSTANHHRPDGMIS